MCDRTYCHTGNAENPADANISLPALQLAVSVDIYRFKEASMRSTPVYTRSHPSAVLSSTSSDSHTWNLVFLQLLLEEIGYGVTNLGPCVSNGLLVRRCLETSPGLVVISTVNGHGFEDGLRLIQVLRNSADLAKIPVVIGGKLGIDDLKDNERVAKLLEAGFTAVFGAGDLERFRSYAASLVLKIAS